ncbi:MAG: aminotransferase class I/II-fold pyridoxal phosphate-dependent enzyme [Sneathiella sp.]
MTNSTGRDISPFIAMEVLKAANLREQAGEAVFHMEVGQPGTPAPTKVIAAAKVALDTRQIGYTDALGIPPLRAAIAKHYRDFYGVEVSPERVVVTTGSSGGFLLTFLAAFAKGARVVLAEPGYPAYRNILTSLDLDPVGLPCHAETNFQPTPELLDTLDGPLDGLLVASPSNPTGTMIKRDEMAALVDYCKARGMQFISDEIYHGICYDEPATTALELTDEAIVINSFSKFFCMTGWRLGWMVVPENMIGMIERIAQNLFISPPALSQYAAIAAFDDMAEMEANVKVYARNRDILLKELPKLGLDRLAAAEGAFYIYADVRDFTNDAVEFCRRMLRETGVATTPGLDFDPHRGNSYVRFSFAGSTATIEAAIERLKDWSAFKKGSR